MSKCPVVFNASFISSIFFLSVMITFSFIVIVERRQSVATSSPYKGGNLNVNFIISDKAQKVKHKFYKKIATKVLTNARKGCMI